MSMEYVLKIFFTPGTGKGFMASHIKFKTVGFSLWYTALLYTFSILMLLTVFLYLSNK